MQNDVGRTFHELYVLEIDGVKQSEHRVFIEALKSGLELKRQCPRSDVKLRDAHENTQHDGTPVPKRTWGIGRGFAGARPIKTSHGRISWLNG